MSKVSLKEYLREINSLIEENHIKEAREHCAYILKKYPKYIDVYRMLGKAHLESSRYDEAEKIFIRVLAVLPDDFVSHLGMSVIKEEQEDLDAAIWHMERAYELKSTQTIHEELHRLFTMRDGVSPPKPLITRGALIRINVRSGLYQQALKEIDHALKEDPQRLDLEILRAQIYFQLKNIPLAVRYCKMILQKRPYAYDANILMTEIASTPEQAEPFKQRLFELDPYTSLVDNNTSLEEIPDQSIMIEKLVIPMQSIHEEEPNQEDIVQDSDSEMAEQNEEMPPSPEEGSQNLEDSTLLEANSHENERIPDFMKEAGWSAGDERTPEEEQAMIAEYDELIPEEEPMPGNEGISETEIPDWLKDLEPIQEEPVEEIANRNEEQEKIAWLSDILPEDETQESVSDEDLGQDPAAVNLESIRKSPFSSAPDFGQDLDADQEWLEKVSSGEPRMPNPEQQSQDRPSRMPESEEIMDFSYEESEEKEESSPAEDENGEDIDSAIAWLEGLAAKQGAEEEVLFSDEDARQHKPDWITEEPEIEEPTFYVDENEPVAKEETEVEDFVDFIESIDETPLVEEQQLAGGSPESLQDLDDADVPEWLKTIAPPESVENAGPESASQARSRQQEISIPEHLDSLFVDSPAIESPELTPDIEYPDETEAVSPAEDSLSDEEEVPSDLRSEQFATTAVLDFIKKEVEDDIDEVDDWLKSLPQSPQDEPDTSLEEDIPTLEQDLETETNGSQIEIEDESDVEFIDHYFSGEMEESPLTEQETEASEPYTWEQEYEDLTADDSDLPDWITGIEEEESVAPEIEPEPEVLAETEAVFSEDKPSSDSQDLPDWITTDVEEVEEETHPDETLHFDTVDGEEQDELTVDEFDDVEIEQQAAQSSALPQTEQDQDLEEVFLIAKNKLHNGEFEEAFPRLRHLLEMEQWREQVIETLIYDIENYHPIEIESWVLLGDTYNKQGRLQDALDAYTKAEEFIK